MNIWLTGRQGHHDMTPFYSPTLHSMWMNSNSSSKQQYPSSSYYPPTPPPRSSSDSKSEDFSSSTSNASPHNNNSIESLKESYANLEQHYQAQDFHHKRFQEEASASSFKRELQQLPEKSDETSSETSSATSASPAPASSSSAAYPYFSHPPPASDLASPFYGSYTTTPAIKADSKAKAKAQGKYILAVVSVETLFPQLNPIIT